MAFLGHCGAILFRGRQIDHVRDFGCGKLYYKTFYIDEPTNVIYVGAMDRVFRLNLQNISQSLCDNQKDVVILEPTGSDILNCVSKGKRELFECRNHIRVIQPMDHGRKLYICGTNAHNPKDYVIYSNLTHLPRNEYVPGIGLGIGKCPYDPLDNSTAVWVEHGNPNDLPGLYSGTNAEFTKADSVIFRSDLYNLTSGRKEHNFKRTLKYDSKWLDKPNFVGSFDIGEYVYFFFRERAVEYINCGKAIYSRIARVCKNDKGGKYNIIGQNWATYLKARINCSISSEFPFYFNEIQSVYKMPNDNNKFYATFTTNTHGIVGSAICSYDIRDINAAFDGKFKEQVSSNSAWLPVLNSKVPDPRPGVCINDTSTLPDSVLNFIRKHPLMDKAVDHEHAQPVFFKRDVILTKLVVDRIRIDKLNQEYLVYFVGTNTGSIYKIVQYTKFGQRHSSLLDILDIAKNEPIREMGISKKTGCLYIATDHSVKQIDLAMCNRRYDSCYRCIQDPYCGWDKDTGACKPFQLGLYQDVGNETSGICDTSVLKKRITASYGQTLHLSCFVRVPEVLRQKSIRWFHHSAEKGRYEINYTPSKYIETSEGGLVVISINEGDAGRYDSYLDGTLLCSYSVNVDAHRCTPPTKKNDYQKIYSHWCNEFEKYKSAMKQWQEKQEQCHAKDKKGVKHINDVIIDDKIV
ncbi:semaphorin-2A-like [Condylostylus longicornis]|uniref:semaphorin-2A-like n=1 Tax=Condylostylus longicornis TaxID=2530218 RepID=UPI00244DD9C0|nr:semaphorin-2A-like [Condylostylus longicornis]